MIRSLLVVSVSIAVLAAGVPLAAAHTQTTSPGVVYTLKVILTNTSISIQKDRFTRKGVPYYPRGGVIHYTIANHGTRPYALKIWDEVTAAIPPGRQGSMLVNWNFRGTYHYALLYDGKPAGPKGYIVIF